MASSIYYVDQYNPYKDLGKVRNSEYFEQMFLEYFEDYKAKIQELKNSAGNAIDDNIEQEFIEVIKLRNDEEIDRILREYSLSFNQRKATENEDAIAKLRQEIRLIKDIILAVEPANMERLQKLDERVDRLIDSVSMSLGASDNVEINGIRLDNLLDWFQPTENMLPREYTEYVLSFKKMVQEACEHYRKNYSVKVATRYIKDLTTKMDKILDDRAFKLGFLKDDKKFLRDLMNIYRWDKPTASNYDEWLTSFKDELNKFSNDVTSRYSEKMARKILSLIELKSGELLDETATLLRYPNIHERRLKAIFETYDPSELNIFLQIYDDEEERNLVIKEYQNMTSEQKSVFMMRLYDKYIRIFKGKIREFNKDIRRIYSLQYANKMVDSVNRRADELIQEKAKLVGKPIPRNPWFIRKYLWADTENFATENGVNFRKYINPFMRALVRVAMKNSLVIEERPQFDPTKQYIFVPTHYFTEDIIGLYASLSRQTYVLMGTTDQIENNFLMLAAIMLGLFYVDREDVVSRRECVDKQNRIIDYRSNVANYISGSWENSENELQPLSFSGPYRTSVAKDVQIVPVGLYNVSEEKKIYVRYGKPLDLTDLHEQDANGIIRDTLASMHFKQMAKYSVPIDTIEIDGYGKTHNLPYNQHIYYMEQVANEYWNQYWSKPFAKEEIGLRPKKVADEADVYSFVDNLSREKLTELAGYLSEPMIRRYERDERYNMVKYIDENYERLKNGRARRKTKKKN